MSSAWNDVLKLEESSAIQLMKNSIDCTIKLIRQIKSGFVAFEEIWEAFCKATPVLVDQYLFYLAEFKVSYLEVQNSSQSLSFKSPLISGLIMR